MKITKHIFFFSALLFCVAFVGCMEWDYGTEEEFESHGRGLFILNEGNFQYGNGTLSFYDPDTREVENEIFLRANAMKLGDVVESMTMFNDQGWIVVNNSHVVFAIDPNTFREIGRIENLTSPRYIHFIDDTKAYITQLWDNRIFIVDPRSFSVVGHITVPGMAQSTGSTEQMVQLKEYVYCNCWSYQNRIIKINTQTDSVEQSLAVGIQPRNICADAQGKLWVLTDGGYDGSVYGHERPQIIRIDPERFAVEQRFILPENAQPCDLKLNGCGDTLYWVDNDVWRMPVNALELPIKPFIESRGTRFFGMTIDPATSDIYVADAIDYQQQGKIYRYNNSGKIVDEFYVGVNPAKFCWKEQKGGNVD